MVVVDDPSAVTDDELREFAASGLAYFKVPSKWEIGSVPLPRNATGKVVRKQLPGQG